MRLSQKTDYGLAAVIYLSQQKENRRCSLEEISRDTKIPEEFLRKICQTLTKYGVVESFRGKDGGVNLARSPENISLFDIVEWLEDKKGLVRCLRGEYCPRSNQCPASPFWQEIQQRLFHTLQEVTIEDLIRGRILSGTNLGETIS